MKSNFWDDLPKPFFILAPMEDVTDIVFRKVIAKAARPDVFFTEFTSTDSYFHVDGRKSIRNRLLFDDTEQPIVAHLWGDNPDYFKKMSLAMAEKGFQGIDINMGCPAPNVFKHGRGAGLILRPDRAAQLIQAAKAGGLPVSVKTRLGHASVSEYKDWLGHLLKQDIANLSIHLRTKVEMSKADAHWELIPEIKKLRDKIAPQTLITINGDILDYQMGMKLVEKTGVDGVMIGRGIFQNPFAFEKNPINHSFKDHINLLYYHLDLFDFYKGSNPELIKPLYRFFKIYVRNIDQATDLRMRLMETETTDEIRSILSDFEKENPKYFQ